MAQRLQIRRADAAHAHRRQGGGGLKEQVEHAVCIALDQAEGDRPAQQDQDVEHDDSQRPPHQLSGDTSFCGGDVLLAPQDGQHRQQQHGDGRDFHAAARRCAGRADEHQQHTHQLGAVMHLIQRDGVKSRRTHGDRLEEGIQQLFPHVHACAQGFRARPFHQGEEQRADRQERTGQHQHDAGMQRELTEAEALMHHIQHDGKADAAQDDQRRNREQHHRIVGKDRQAAEAAKEVEARIAKRAHRMPQAVPDSLAPIIQGDKARRQDHRANALDAQRQ